MIRYDYDMIVLFGFRDQSCCFHEVICMYQVQSLPAFRTLFLFPIFIDLGNH